MQLIYDDQNDEQNRPRARQKKKMFVMFQMRVRVPLISRKI